eukprot:CAMPEP_0184699214 /NCGR_PEP_ID=MMETSP0313-20130426/5566_1 /TAXON_ID=2792 /ORGANISM="Porphyridium aerugineum, Strain SAG 1380-2" /LENGTH=401 /DNA_ID=CAMNT_0027158271 /DNA_START=360 /DNA_END=1565 /DNA_ORIENTATION=+
MASNFTSMADALRQLELSFERIEAQFDYAMAKLEAEFQRNQGRVFVVSQSSAIPSNANSNSNSNPSMSYVNNGIKIMRRMANMDNSIAGIKTEFEWICEQKKEFADVVNNICIAKNRAAIDALEHSLNMPDSPSQNHDAEDEKVTRPGQDAVLIKHFAKTSAEFIQAYNVYHDIPNEPIVVVEPVKEMKLVVKKPTTPGVSNKKPERPKSTKVAKMPEPNAANESKENSAVDMNMNKQPRSSLPFPKDIHGNGRQSLGLQNADSGMPPSNIPAPNSKRLSRQPDNQSTSSHITTKAKQSSVPASIPTSKSPPLPDYEAISKQSYQRLPRNLKMKATLPQLNVIFEQVYKVIAASPSGTVSNTELLGHAERIPDCNAGVVDVLKGLGVIRSCSEGWRLGAAA